MGKALLISEHSGHMFPTKSYDPWAKRQEHALRHARVLNAALADGEHAGCFGWCMFDYPTHKDFGSGDKVCYHGVMDAFRNPKLAAALYASQGETPVLELGSPMDIGDYPGGNLGPIYAFTNADELELYKNDKFVARFRPKGWDGLDHGPILIDDTIGCLLETQEGFDKKKAAAIKAALQAAGKYGLAALPAKEKLRMLWVMARYGLSYAAGMELYGKYVGNWGGEATRWRLTERKGGTDRSVSRVNCPGTALHLEVLASQTALHEGDTYDMAAVRVRLLDENGNPAPYAQLPVQFKTRGAVALVGPQAVTAEGGLCGCYVRTMGRAGRGSLSITAEGLEPVTVTFVHTERRTVHGGARLRLEHRAGNAPFSGARSPEGRVRVGCPLGQPRSLTGRIPLDGEEGQLFSTASRAGPTVPDSADRRGLDHLPPPLGVKHFGLDRYGDNYFVDLPGKAGVFHGETWAYVRQGEGTGWWPPWTKSPATPLSGPI